MQWTAAARPDHGPARFRPGSITAWPGLMRMPGEGVRFKLPIEGKGEDRGGG